MATYPTVYSISTGITRKGKGMIVTCPKNLPLNHTMTLLCAVRARSDRSATHDFEIPSDWANETVKDNYAASAVSYKQLWFWSKQTAAGDEAWEFTSVGQEPNRLWVMIVWKNTLQTSDGIDEVQTGGSTTAVTAQTMPGVTIASIGNVHLVATTQYSDGGDIQHPPIPQYGRIFSRQSPASAGKYLSIGLTAYFRNAAATGATGTVAYDAVSDHYCSIGAEILRGTGALIFNNQSRDWMAVPYEYASGPVLLEHAAGFRPEDAVAAALRNEKNVPVLLADLQPYPNDAPGAVREHLRLSSGFYSKSYLPAIKRFPQLRWTLFGNDTIGGGVGDTAGALELANDRAKAPGEE